jgi:YD repeat-containing protein
VALGTGPYLPTIADQTKEQQSLYGYDARHRLTSITHQLCTVSTGHACSSTTATGSVTYEYDDSDNRKRVTENNGSASTDFRYCHDARNQLTGRGSTVACDTSSVESSLGYLSPVEFEQRNQREVLIA